MRYLCPRSELYNYKENMTRVIGVSLMRYLCPRSEAWGNGENYENRQDIFRFNF